MAWNKVPMEEKRKQLVDLAISNKHSIAELCREFDISRPTAYKWLDRFEKEGIEGLKNRSSAPKTQANLTPTEIEDEILAIKFTYPKWGPKKVKATLDKELPYTKWPSKTTIGTIFGRNGLTIPRKIRIRLAERASPLAQCHHSNDVWCVDFKGWFLTKNQEKCDPLTLTDAFSRYLFTSTKLKNNTTEHVWAILDRNFREYGLPLRIRSDNGPPFASICPGRLSGVSIKLIKAGVIPEWIDPGKPQQNGRHERMHLTMEQECVYPGELTQKEQQMKFDEFCYYYNFIRPHEALNQQRPGEIYMPSTRTWNGILKSPDYPDEYKIGRVKSCGKMSWRGGEIYISRVLEGEPIGIKKTPEGHLSAYYGHVYLGNIENYELKTERRQMRKRRKYTCA